MISGFTLIELLLIIAILALLGASTTPFLSRFLLQANFDATGDHLLAAIHKAQSYAMDGKGGETWGVCLSGASVRVFSGSCNSPTFSEDTAIPGSITVSSFTSTTFNQRGEPSQAMAVMVSSALESLTVSVNSAGGVSAN